MKHYLLVHNRKVGDTGTLPVSGQVHDADTVEDAISVLENGELLSAVILDTPSEISGVRELISNINDRNSDLLAFPVLILTDEEHIEADEQYLGGVVVDCVMKPLREAVLKNRLANAEQLVSSVSFTEFSRMLRSLPANIYLKETGVFSAVNGVLAGKPMDETYAEEYKQLLTEVIDRPELPVVFNLNIGHAMPRCIMPFGVHAVVNAEKQVIRFDD